MSTAVRIFLVAILAVLIIVGVDSYLKYHAIQQAALAEAAQEAQQVENQNLTVGALTAAGVPAQQVSQGFWYIMTDRYGDQSVAYFDLAQWSSQLDLTQAQIDALATAVASSTVVDKNSMYEVPQNQLPPDLQFHNAIYSGQLQSGQYTSIQSSLQTAYQNGTANTDQLWELAYMDELQGDYADRDAVNAENCKLYKQRCAGDIAVTVTGTVVDESNRPVQDATVSVLSDTSVAPVMTDDKGDYSLKLSVLPMEKIRVSAVKPDFTDGVASTIVLGSGKAIYALDPIQLTSPNIVVTIDTAAHTVSDPADVANPDGSFVLHATSSTYAIPAGAIVNADGTPYMGQVDVYLYEFTKNDAPTSLTTLDTFNSVAGYAGNVMQTLGMPYIQFFDATSGQQLDVLKSNPMLLTYNIPGWEDMKDNFYDRPQGSLTDQQIQTILSSSQADPTGFPITAQFLADNQISTFAAFWVFDHRTGVWENEGMRLLNSEGTVQVPFYTTSN